MKKFALRQLALLLFFLVSAKAAEVGKWDIGGKVSLVQLGRTLGVKAAVTAEYRIQTYLTWRTDLEMLMRELDDISKSDMSVPTNILFYPLASRAFIDPYIGPGLTYTHTFLGANWLGANLLAGINFRPVRRQTFGIETKYTLGLLPHIGKGSWEVGLTGSWELQF